jgi:hypothetical protein
MPQPTSNQVHVDAVLSNISLAVLQDPSNFVSAAAFPQVSVAKQTDLYYIYDQADFLRDQVMPRADGTESAGSGYGLSTASYSATVYALHKDIGDQARANSDGPLNADTDAARFLAMQMLIRQERDWAAAAFTTGIWSTDATPAALWSTTSTPIADVQTGKSTILSATGMLPNTLVMSYAVYSALIDNADITDRIKYTSQESVTPSLLARLFDVDRVLVMSSVYNTAAEGATGTYTQIGDKDALLCYVAPQPGLMVPSAGYSMVWNGVSSGLGVQVGVSKLRMEHLKSDRIEIEAAWDFKVVSAPLGYFFSNAVA